MSETNKLRDDILLAISSNYDNHDFYLYITHCIEKWNEIKERNEIIDLIVDFLSTNYNIPKDEFIRSNSAVNYSIRGVFFHSLKTILGLSYSEISILVGRPKASVYKIVMDIDFMVNSSGHKTVKEALHGLKKELDRKQANVPKSCPVKSD